MLIWPIYFQLSFRRFLFEDQIEDWRRLSTWLALDVFLKKTSSSWKLLRFDKIEVDDLEILLIEVAFNMLISDA